MLTTIFETFIKSLIIVSIPVIIITMFLSFIYSYYFITFVTFLSSLYSLKRYDYFIKEYIRGKT